MMDAHDVAMIIRRMIAYWLIILMAAVVIVLLVRAWRRHPRRGKRHRHKRRR